ncbi:hypothetical protein EYF80_011274 [Liparis tanakae]|uniref:Uncharacterized protein n=1 Tax=Liparis tanakae TaxID=230148 RepID=A0A4Z2IL23_9TELE|nr:hypothetical protein EYF80_011274 [Liparis tanakae]
MEGGREGGRGKKEREESRPLKNIDGPFWDGLIEMQLGTPKKKKKKKKKKAEGKKKKKKKKEDTER